MYIVETHVEIKLLSKDKKESSKFQLVNMEIFDYDFKIIIPANPYFNSFIFDLKEIPIFEDWLSTQMENYKMKYSEKISKEYGFPLDRIEVNFEPRRVEWKKGNKKVLIYSKNSIQVIKYQQELQKLQLKIAETINRIEEIENGNLNSEEKLHVEEQKKSLKEQAEEVENSLASNIDWFIGEGVRLKEVN